MVEQPPLHRFDPTRAARYEPKATMVKTAILVDVVDPGAITVISTPFGEQRLKGPFYIVEEGERSYGAAAREFTELHQAVGPNQWIKVENVLGYQVEDRSAVETFVDDLHETTVVAEPGDWIVEQATGEVMVVKPESFARRYIRQGTND